MFFDVAKVFKLLVPVFILRVRFRNADTTAAEVIIVGFS